MEKEKGSEVSLSSETLTKEQSEYLADRATQAYEMVAELTAFLGKIGVNLLQAAITIQVPGCKHPKVVVLGHPNISPAGLRDLLEAMGEDAEFCVRQAQVVTLLAAKKSAPPDSEDPTHDCENCPDKDDCELFKTGEKVTIH